MRVKKLKKIFSGLLVLALAFTVACSSLMNVSAAPANSSTNSNPEENAGVSITKVIKLAEGVELEEEETFNFTATLKTVNGVAPGSAYSSTVKTISTSVTAVINSTGTNGEIILESEDMMDGVTFPHAGVYKYIVKETAGLNDKYTYDGNEYHMWVYVKNHVVGEVNTPYVSDVTVFPVEDYSNDTDDSEKNAAKVDPTPTTDGSGNGFKFTNIYNVKTEMSIEKLIDGTDLSFVNFDTDYAFKVVFTLPSTVTTDVEITQQIDSGTVSTVTLYKSPNGTQNTVEFTLKKDQTITFSDLPAGTTYTVVETGGAYQPTAKVTEGGLETTAIAGDKGQDYVLTLGENPDRVDLLVSNKGTNSVVVTNLYEAISITGVIINNLPFILLSIVGVLGLAFVYTNKKRRGNHS